MSQEKRQIQVEVPQHRQRNVWCHRPKEQSWSCCTSLAVMAHILELPLETTGMVLSVSAMSFCGKDTEVINMTVCPLLSKPSVVLKWCPLPLSSHSRLGLGSVDGGGGKRISFPRPAERSRIVQQRIWGSQEDRHLLLSHTEKKKKENINPSKAERNSVCCISALPAWSTAAVSGRLQQVLFSSSVLVSAF